MTESWSQGRCELRTEDILLEEQAVGEACCDWPRTGSVSREGFWEWE